MIKKLIFLVVFFFIGIPVFAQSVDTVWVRRYNGPGNGADWTYAIAVDGSGNVYVTGRSTGSGLDYDYASIKYYSNGDTAWVRRYNGQGNGVDEAHAITLDGSGNVYVTGQSIGSGTSEDYATVRYYPNGDTTWVRRYNGPGNAYDAASAITADASGKVYVTGGSAGSGTNLDYTTIKYYSNGDTAWVKRYNGPGNGADWTSAITVDDSGNVYVTGQSIGSGLDYDYATIKYYSNGDTAWVRRYNGWGTGYDYGVAIAVDGSGNVYVTGKSTGSGTSYDYATIKYYSNGDTAWVRRYNGPGNSSDNANALAIDGSGNVYVTGQSWNGTSYDYATIKYYSNGDTAWVKRYNGPGNGSDGALAITVDASGSVFVTGQSTGSGTNLDYATIKYYSNGDIAWLRRYNGPGNDWDFADDIVVDGLGNVYLTGTSLGSGTGSDYATIKYSLCKTRTDTLTISAYSPVDLIVTDPTGDSIGIDFNTIPGATYDTLTDYNGDEELDDRVNIPNPLIGEYMVRVVGEPGSGGGTYTLAVKLNGNEDTPMVSGTAPGPGEVDTVYYTVIEYLRGDANSDGSTSVSDVIFLINYLFKGGLPPNPLFLGDANCCMEGSGNCEVVNISVSDVIYLINYLFKGGTAPCS